MPLPRNLAGVAISAILVALVTAPPPARAAVTSRQTAAGAIELHEDGRVLGRMVPATPPQGRGPSRVTEFDVAGHRVVQLDLAERDTAGSAGRVVERWLAERSGATLRPLWTGKVGPQDADGEASLDVVVTPSAIERFESLSRGFRCDGAPVRLFAAVWDFGARRFRPAEPATAASGARPIEAVPLAAGIASQGPSGAPVGDFRFSFASTSLGVARAADLVAPSALNDGRPDTVWAAEASAARGAVLSARGGTDAYAVTGLRMSFGATAGPRPERISLLLGPSAGERFEATLPPVAAGVPVWIPLPSPIHTRCISVVIDRVQPTGDAAPPLRIAALDVFTELDAPGGLTRLARDAVQGPGCDSRMRVLASLGEPARDALLAALPEVRPPAVNCVLEGIIRLPPPTDPAARSRAGDHLIGLLELAGAVAATAADERRLTRALLHVGAAPVPTLARRLADQTGDAQSRASAARLLASLAGSGPPEWRPASRAALMAALGTGSPGSAVPEVRAAIASIPAPVVEDLLAAFQATPVPEQARRAELLAVLAAATPREPERAPAVAAAAAATLQGGSGFELRARAVQALGSAAGPIAIAALRQVRSTDDDPVVRMLATRALASHPTPEATSALRQALTDLDPGVRDEAARGLGRRRERSAAGELAAALDREPWPFARRSQVEALAALCVKGSGERFLALIDQDADPVRQAAMDGLVACRDPRGKDRLGRLLGRRAESPALRARAARLLGELGDPSASGVIAEALGRLEAESQADPAAEEVIIEAAAALGALGGPPASQALIRLLSSENASMQRAALGGLGLLCAPGEANAAIERATTSRDGAVAASARAARRNCSARRPATGRP